MSDDTRVIAAKITRAGLSAAFAADRRGLTLKLSHVGVGTGGGTGYVPNGWEAGLRSQFARVAISGGEAITPTEIMVQAMFEGTAAGWVNEIGVFDEAGVLFAVWSEEGAPLAYKSAGVPLILALTLALAELPADKLEIVVGAPGVNILVAEPMALLGGEIVRLQRRIVESEIARLSPTIAASFKV